MTGNFPAFPVPEPHENLGMTYIEWYASIAMLGLLAGRDGTWPADKLAETAWQYAKEMVIAEHRYSHPGDKQ